MDQETGDPQGDARQARDETPQQQYDRNMSELLQELRVLQTGTQILAGFLLTLPFQSRFEMLTRPQVILFLVATVLAVVTVLLLVTPVSVHRALFHQNNKRRVVGVAHAMARAGVAALGLTMVAVLTLVFSVVLGWAWAIGAAAVAAVCFVVAWWLVPRRWSRSSRAPGHPLV